MSNKFNGKLYVCFALFIFTVVLTACSNSPDFKVYEGNALRIAVVGDSPKVKENQVTFTEISFKEMNSEKLKSYDAVFIREDHLLEASEAQYADIYLNSNIPFFFIGTENFLPFTEKDLKYDDSSNWAAGSSYTVGVLTTPEDNTLKNWGYGLYNDKKTDENMKEMYSRMFKTIDELNH